MKSKRTILLLVVVLVFSLAMTTLAIAQGRNNEPRVHYTLTVLHNNDGESQVVDAGSGIEDFGGAARFKTVVDNLRSLALDRRDGYVERGRAGVLMISSGDNFLAGPEFNVGLQNGVPFYDTIAMELIGYDAVALGNHDFDFGPNVLADFIEGYTDPPEYISANLDFSGEPRLQALVDSSVIQPAATAWERGERIGIIGLETPNLPFISSPGAVVVDDDLVTHVMNAVNRMRNRGIDIIIVASHLQNIQNEIELVSHLQHVDLVIAGGGDELLANADDLLIPGDDANVYGDYPQWATDSTGTMVPVVTTSGEYKYVGRLVLGFDRFGNIIDINEDFTGPVRVATGDCNGTLPCDDAVTPDPTMQAMVVDPVQAGLDVLASDVIGVSEVDLDGTRDGVRGQETNEGNLIADSQLWQARKNAAEFGVAEADVALQNGGGIRNNTIIAAGDITELDTFDMVPFANFVAIVEDVPREQFKQILENAVSCTQAIDITNNPLCGTGRFAQIAGFSFEWSASGTAMEIDIDGNVLVEGTRVQSVVLDDGAVIVENGAVVAGDALHIALNNFSAGGGDQYPFFGAPFTILGATYQQALANYIRDADGLNGLISAADYPEGGEGRITPLP